MQDGAIQSLVSVDVLMSDDRLTAVENITGYYDLVTKKQKETDIRLRASVSQCLAVKFGTILFDRLNPDEERLEGTTLQATILAETQLRAEYDEHDPERLNQRVDDNEQKGRILEHAPRVRLATGDKGGLHFTFDIDSLLELEKQLLALERRKGITSLESEEKQRLSLEYEEKQRLFLKYEEVFTSYKFETQRLVLECEEVFNSLGILYKPNYKNYKLTVPHELVGAFIVLMSPMLRPEGKVDQVRFEETLNDMYKKAKFRDEGPTDDSRPPEGLSEAIQGLQEAFGGALERCAQESREPERSSNIIRRNPGKSAASVVVGLAGGLALLGKFTAAGAFFGSVMPVGGTLVGAILGAIAAGITIIVAWCASRYMSKTASSFPPLSPARSSAATFPHRHESDSDARARQHAHAEHAADATAQPSSQG